VSKTLYDRFKKVVKEFRTEDRISKSRSGVEEIFDEKTQLLGDICSQMDDESERLADEKNQKTKAEQALTSAGAEMRNRAMKRRSLEAEDIGPMDGDIVEPPSSKKARKRLHSADGSVDFGDGIHELLAKRLENDSSGRELAEQRISFGREKVCVRLEE
jgi:hypothetical protein